MVVVTLSQNRRPGGDKRGSAAARRARKHWMLSHFGTGEMCFCVHCGTDLDFASVEADRIVPGAGYRRDNVIPSCGECNKRRGDKPLSRFNPALHRRIKRRKLYANAPINTVNRRNA